MFLNLKIFIRHTMDLELISRRGPMMVLVHLIMKNRFCQIITPQIFGNLIIIFIYTILVTFALKWTSTH